MKKQLSIIVLTLSFFITAAKWNDSFYDKPIKVAQAFMNAIIEKRPKKANKYLVKRLKNNNHWVHATRKERKKTFTSWIPVEFRQKKDTMGYVIFEAPYGHIAVKFEKENGKWLWANE